MDVVITEVMITDLIEWYPSFSTHLVPSGGRRGGGRRAPGSRLPTRLDALDLIVDIHNKTVAWEERARSMLGHNSRPNRDPVRSLEWLKVALTIIFENDDSTLYSEIRDGVADLHAQARAVKGETIRPLRLELRCPYCTKPDCRCAVEDCPSCKGLVPNHSWFESDWPMLGLIMKGASNAQPS